MAMEVKIHKKLGEYELDVHWKSTKKRIGILGASGSGKSLTLKSIAGIEHPDQGHIQIGDHVLYDSDSRICLKPQKRNVGYMFQNYALFPTMTVEQNVGAGLAGNKKKKQEQVQKMIRHFRLEGLEKRLPRELSGGQQQRVALASVLVLEPDILVIDEPTSQLDPQETERVFEIIKTMKQMGKTIILVEHKMELVAEYCDEVVVLHQGKVIRHGDKHDVLSEIELEKFGVMLPLTVYLANELKKHGVRMKDNIITSDEMADQLQKIGKKE